MRSKQAGNVARQVTRRPKGLASRRDARETTFYLALKDLLRGVVSALSELVKRKRLLPGDPVNSLVLIKERIKWIIKI